MERISNFILLFLLSIFTFVVNGCSSDELCEIEESNNLNAQHTLKMNFEGRIVGFDQDSTTKSKLRAATVSAWSEGDKIFIVFSTGTTSVAGEATYSTTTGWSISYDGELETGSNLKCEARYFANATFANSSLVSINSKSEIYEDLSAIYAYSDGALTVTATLSPKTGRLRFMGTAGTVIHTTGISVYTTYSPTTNTFTSSNATIASTVGTDGYTPYIYGYFTDSDRSLGLVGDDFAFTRTCTSDMFNSGESGYMAIPSEESHNSWRNGLYVKANGVEFKMIPVVGHSDGFFLLAETETTEALYNSVSGTSTTASLLPTSDIAYSSILTWITKLNAITSLNFSLPSGTQWLYAAKGGNKSQGYTYYGSNTPGDVAWYSGNCSSKQIVKTKAPNELGLYDMNGNVDEYSATKSGSYYYIIYGGSYESSATGLSNTNSGDWCYDQTGFRLMLTFK